MILLAALLLAWCSLAILLALAVGAIVRRGGTIDLGERLRDHEPRPVEGWAAPSRSRWPA